MNSFQTAYKIIFWVLLFWVWVINGFHGSVLEYNIFTVLGVALLLRTWVLIGTATWNVSTMKPFFCHSFSFFITHIYVVFNLVIEFDVDTTYFSGRSFFEFMLASHLVFGLQVRYRLLNKLVFCWSDPFQKNYSICLLMVQTESSGGELVFMEELHVYPLHKPWILKCCILYFSDVLFPFLIYALELVSLTWIVEFVHLVIIFLNCTSIQLIRFFTSDSDANGSFE